MFIIMSDIKFNVYVCHISTNFSIKKLTFFFHLSGAGTGTGGIGKNRGIFP